MEALKNAPRINSRDLAEATGANDATIRRRRYRLEQLGYVRYFALPNPRMLGYIDQMMFVKVEPSKLLAVAEALSCSPLTRDVDIMNGPFNLLVTGYFRSADDFLDFLTGCVAVQDGVQETQTANSLRTVKRYFSKIDPVVEQVRDAE
jgi:DNA-binding Lrp family transcriptional regulator